MSEICTDERSSTLYELRSKNAFLKLNNKLARNSTHFMTKQEGNKKKHKKINKTELTSTLQQFWWQPAIIKH